MRPEHCFVGFALNSPFGLAHFLLLKVEFFAN